LPAAVAPLAGGKAARLRRKRYPMPEGVEIISTAAGDDIIDTR